MTVDETGVDELGINRFVDLCVLKYTQSNS